MQSTDDGGKPPIQDCTGGGGSSRLPARQVGIRGVEGG